MNIYLALWNFHDESGWGRSKLMIPNVELPVRTVDFPVAERADGRAPKDILRAVANALLRGGYQALGR